MVYYAYVLESKKFSRNYYGSCQDIEERLKLHNLGKVKSTKPFRPWNVIYFETFETRSEAYQRELFFKSLEGKIFLRSKGLV